MCPPSLINNWKAEIHKWFPSNLAPTTVFVSKSSKNDMIVHEFITSHATRRPLLVIGYEMFRVYAEALNTVNNLELMICDEGHRLKSGLEAKTTLALGNCIATRRLLLTGTPIQNNLKELFAIVRFVAPGYLGDMKDFNANYSIPIEAGKEPSASEAVKLAGKAREKALQEKLAGIMLRRTKEEILVSILPERKEFFLFSPLSESQQIKYTERANSLLNTHPFEQVDTEWTPSALDNSPPSRSSSPSPSPPLKKMNVLAEIMALRLVATAAAAPQQPHQQPSAAPEADLAERRSSIFRRSAKLHCLDALLRAILDLPTRDKVVVVSPFTSTLDEVQQLCATINSMAPSPPQSGGCAVLRIDGSVPMERRNKIVQYFNQPSGGRSPFRVLLLSSKAGGVGLNLVGANRMIMMEPDWNPANDLQAMGRVWREGQDKPVFIYRLAASGTVEESILRRQTRKLDLYSLADGKQQEETEGKKRKRKREGEEEHADTESDEDIVRLFASSAKQLRDLILPSALALDGINSAAAGRHDSVLEGIQSYLKQERSTNAVELRILPGQGLKCISD